MERDSHQMSAKRPRCERASSTQVYDSQGLFSVARMLHYERRHTQLALQENAPLTIAMNTIGFGT